MCSTQVAKIYTQNQWWFNEADGGKMWVGGAKYMRLQHHQKKFWKRFPEKWDVPSSRAEHAYQSLDQSKTGPFFQASEIPAAYRKRTRNLLRVSPPETSSHSVSESRSGWTSTRFPCPGAGPWAPPVVCRTPGACCTLTKAEDSPYETCITNKKHMQVKTLAVSDVPHKLNTSIP